MFLDREEKEYVRPYALIEDGVLKKYIVDESGIVNIPDDVEVIAAGVFSWEGMPEDQIDGWESENSQTIKKVHIPASVKVIEPGAFVDTIYLRELSVDPLCPAAVLIDGILFSRDKTRVIYATPQMPDFKEYTLPTTVKVIDSFAFVFRFFGHLIIPNSVETIGDYAFTSSDFRKITIPDSIDRLGEGIFYGCRYGEVVELPASLKEIGKEAFYKCRDLEIHAPASSYAIAYAKENQIPFKEI